MKTYVLYDRNYEANGPDIDKKMAEAFESSDGRLSVHWLGEISSTQNFPNKEILFKVAITFGGMWVMCCDDNMDTERQLNLHYLNMRQHRK